MTRDEFWDHIRATRRRDPDEHVERLVKRLAKLPPAEILDFDHWWDAGLAEAYHWDLWGAAYLINGGCSDDGFTDFRSWLILQGRKVFEAAVENPDSLAAVLDGDEVECECYPGPHAWFAATGTDPDDGYAAFEAALRARHPRAGRGRRRPRGRQWDFDHDAAVRRRLPRLAAVYLGGD